MIEIDKVNFDGVLSSFKKDREEVAFNLRKKLDRAEKWQARFNKLTDVKIEQAATERLEKIKKLAKESHVSISLINTSPNSRGQGGVNATYHRGDVTLALQGWLTIDPDGLVALDLYVTDTYKRALRISIGQRTTITNNILQVLMDKTNGTAR